ncbi:hypothetical protein A3D62_02200 [Candidatus Kaiserbacteria bacterium RIFCSPHIGHO2_02_FULL_49_11]|uniref:Uncharacterized protein n=1 Tax=Candidatus Kaiserbacteria bacterium RIFCSPHIGHO2_02_FULL_49_11 TaxID=1798489 RepID=A0A1F6D084_9BACT|nr:MAG: hypothetical protein A3D62_02200 [Candidatus Kaiserbacteria bacterium RIFCSPHIGHO2_02_FULL_49_11]
MSHTQSGPDLYRAYQQARAEAEAAYARQSDLRSQIVERVHAGESLGNSRVQDLAFLVDPNRLDELTKWFADLLKKIEVHHGEIVAVKFAKMEDMIKGGSGSGRGLQYEVAVYQFGLLQSSDVALKDLGNQPFRLSFIPPTFSPTSFFFPTGGKRIVWGRYDDTIEEPENVGIFPREADRRSGWYEHFVGHDEVLAEIRSKFFRPFGENEFRLALALRPLGIEPKEFQGYDQGLQELREGLESNDPNVRGVCHDKLIQLGALETV